MMTEEQRLDRLERIVKLMIKAGLRARRQSREHDEKMNILIDGQIRADERVADLAVAQKDTERQLQSLAATVERVINQRRDGQL